jgi:ATP-dependent 26S proteasome regulatory subunit
VIKCYWRKSPINLDVNFEELSEKTNHLTGADLAHLLTSAALNAIIKKQTEIC